MVDGQTQPRTNVAQFAVTNVAELLERSAYYGFTSILALYLSDLGYEGLAIGAISVILLALPYVMPLLSAPLAEKLGYKPILLVSLVSYAAGFGVLSSSSEIASILAGVSLVALGAGGFKPVATATIAHVTAPHQRSLGFTIYYTGINVGGFAGPLAVAFLTDSFRAGFVVAGAIMVAALVLTLVAYRSPQPPQKDTSVLGAFGKLGAIFEDGRLVVLLLVFSGFWFLYSMNFSFLALYLDDFVDRPGWFEANLQQSYNPLIVIFLAIPIGAFATKREPRAMMTVGVLLYVVGFTLLAFVQHIAAFFVGLFVATVGEILAYPAFLSYIAGIAPKDRIAVYQSYGFLPLFIGFFFGPLAVGPLYDAIAVEAGRPEVFWAVPISVGVLALVGFLAIAALQGERERRRGGLARAAVVLLLVPLLFGAAAVAGTQDAGEPDGPLGAVALEPVTGTAQAGQPAELPFEVPADARGNLTFVLAWTDEAAQGAGVTNRPDAMRLEVLDAAGTPLGARQAPNAQGGEGRVTVVVPAAGHAGTTLTLLVSLVSSGDQVVLVPLQDPVVLAADDANEFELQPSVETLAGAPATS